MSGLDETFYMDCIVKMVVRLKYVMKAIQLLFTKLFCLLGIVFIVCVMYKCEH